MAKRNEGKFGSAVGIVTLTVIVVLSCLTVWDFAASYTRHAVQAEIQASRYADATEQEISRSCPSRESTECIARIVQTSHDQQRAEADLNAQRDMAKWAFAMVIVSILGTGIGLLGLLFIADTLTATREGNKINRRIGEAQVRAYLSVIRIRWDPLQSDQGTFAGIQFSPMVNNHGNSPALLIYADHILAPVPRTDMPIAVLRTPSKETSITVPAGQDVPTDQTRFIDVETIRMVQSGSHMLISVSDIDYRDVFYEDTRIVRTETYAFEIVFSSRLPETIKAGEPIVDFLRFRHIGNVEVSRPGDPGYDKVYEAATKGGL